MPLREALRSGHGPVGRLFSAAVSLLRSGERSSGWRSFICEYILNSFFFPVEKPPV